jgi:hypothetical protein
LIRSVFISAPAMLSPLQEQAFRRWCNALAAASLRGARILRSDYHPDSWAQLRSVLDRVDGVVVFGFRQLWYEGATWRGGTAEEDVVTTAWTSPWMQIEAGMALMRDLPVLVIPEAGVADGVFEPSRWTGLLFGVEMERDPLGYGGAAWLEAVLRGAAARERVSGKPVAP